MDSHQSGWSVFWVVLQILTLSFIKFVSRLASELLSYGITIVNLLIVAEFTILASILKGLCGSNENSGSKKFYAVYLALIIVQTFITALTCWMDKQCPASYCGCLFSYFALNAIVAVLRCYQPNETEKHRITRKDIYVACMQFVLFLLAFKSPKILALE
uniref:Uncharacterized protein n=1 Tax=Panagrolaimus sp. JU765 TaxID=591449 RepID=A0AC34RBV1_9BILA